jgi:hypothetical protein
MFFSRWPRSGSTRPRRLKNEHLAGSQVVLYKKLCPTLGVPSRLHLPIALDGGSMRLPVGLLVIGMRVPPFLLAIDYALRVYRIGVDLAAMVLGSPLALTSRLAADALVRAELRGFE